MKQIFINLTTNAVKYTQSRSRIQLEILEFVDELSPQVLSRVEGNGEGIALEQREKIFKPFEQADS